MRFGRDEPALLKPEDNGGFEQIDGGEEEQEQEQVGEEGGEGMVVYDNLPPEKETKIVEVIENGQKV
jgi:hypothetical protein